MGFRQYPTTPQPRPSLGLGRVAHLQQLIITHLHPTINHLTTPPMGISEQRYVNRRGSAIRGCFESRESSKSQKPRFPSWNGGTHSENVPTRLTATRLDSAKSSRIRSIRRPPESDGRTLSNVGGRTLEETRVMSTSCEFSRDGLRTFVQTHPDLCRVAAGRLDA